MTKEFISQQMKALQQHICNALEQIDGKAKFQSDNWERVQGGGGITNTITKGQVIEKGGVAFSAVHGDVTDQMKVSLQIEGESFFATGVSIVLHPNNPHVPIIHMNVRFFELNNGTFWFGGGIDLTPHYIVPDQAKLFHNGLKAYCDNFDMTYYPKFKEWADNYFFIPHRNETRGIGGIFYDHLKEGYTKDEFLNFSIGLGKLFPILYGQQVELGKDKEFTEKEIFWRNLRRGRYVEFNLVNDRGTKFGLVSNGRTESILMSLPPDASWEYNFKVEDSSNESETLSLLKKGINWV